MAYSVAATSKTPALIIYLIDISGSMQEDLDGVAKMDHVNQAMERVLTRLVQRSTKGEVISPRYRLGMIAYSDSPKDILGGIQSIRDVAQRGRPRFSATNTTNASAAFELARDMLRVELPNISRHPAPMICHLTDGEFTGHDPEPIALDIMAMSTDDGAVLIENVYLGRNLTNVPIGDVEKWAGIEDPSDLKDPYAKKLFRMSSPLPVTYAGMIDDEGYHLKAGSRMIIPGTSKQLIELAFAMSGATPTV